MVYPLSPLKLVGYLGKYYSLCFLLSSELNFSSVFNDFGSKFTCVDPTGEQPLTGMVVSIAKVCFKIYTLLWLLITVSQDGEGLVTCLDETRHGLEDGDFVTFSEVQGMTELNACEPRKVTVKGPYTFTIGDTTGLGDYIRGGIFTQVKMPKILEFVSLSFVGVKGLL